MKYKKILSSLLLIGAATTTSAEVCKHAPGSVTCGTGVVSNLEGNGIVSVNGTTIEGGTNVNGMLNADDAHFDSLNVNGSVTLFKCIVNNVAEVKGSIKATSSKFEKSLEVFSNSIRFSNSKIRDNIHVHRTDSKTQEIYLDDNSEVGGDIIFDDGNGRVYVDSGSKIISKVIGGKIINK